MRLFSILNWYDEPPSWLAAHVASLARIGVDHLIASDGAYAHFPHAEPRSGSEQAHAILMACDAIGIGCTIDRPQSVMFTEVTKRAYQFHLLETIGATWNDWTLILDADEFISEGTPHIKRDLAESNAEAASAYWWESLDVAATEGKNNTRDTPQIYRNHPNPHRIGEYQARFWRIQRDMTVEGTHYSYLGTCRDGIRRNLKGMKLEHKSSLGYPPVEVIHPATEVRIESRDWQRSAHRRTTKKAYYDLRDEIGLESV